MYLRHSGDSPLLWLPELPSRYTVWIMLAGGWCWHMPKRAPEVCGDRAVILRVGTSGRAGERLADAAFNHGSRAGEVEITATDGATQHQGKIRTVNGRRWWASTGVTLYGNYLPQRACAGQRWAMMLRLRPAHGELNDGGYDPQRSAIARHQTLSGRFTHAELVDGHCSLRAQYLMSLQNRLLIIAGERLSSGWGWESVWMSPEK